MSPLHFQIEGIGFWSEAAPHWEDARAELTAPERIEDSTGAPAPDTPNAPHLKPSPVSLSPNERRRAPLSVLLALSAAEQAIASSGACAAELPSVFASNFGDLPTVDAVCEALARSPELLSPTRFHHSVHNVASGYWAMGQGAHAPSTAVSAAPFSLALGLFEAVALSLDEDQPVLLVAYDVQALGPLATLSPCSGTAALALVLRTLGPWPASAAAVAASPPSWPALVMQWLPGDAHASPPAPMHLAERLGLHQHPLAMALPLMQWLAKPQTPGCTLAFNPGQNLHLRNSASLSPADPASFLPF
jgi:hypothetical protein